MGGILFCTVHGNNEPNFSKTSGHIEQGCDILGEAGGNEPDRLGDSHATGQEYGF